MSYPLIPASLRLSREFNYKGYFRNKKRGKSLFKIMRTLTLNGPMTNWDLTSSIIRSTRPAKSQQAQVYKLLKILREQNITEIIGKQKERKKKNLYGLTDFGLLLTCLSDDEVYLKTDTLLKRYERFGGKKT